MLLYISYITYNNAVNAAVHKVHSTTLNAAKYAEEKH